LDSQQESIHIPNIAKNSSNMLFFYKLEQKIIWPQDSKGERVSKEPGFSQGSIHSLVVLGFL
jgi:hypothetical protein